MATSRPRRPPSVHRPPPTPPGRPGNRVAVRLCGPARRRPPSVHGPFERERVQEGDSVLVAVDREVAVVEVDHRDARAHEPREGEHRDAGAEREGGVGVTKWIVIYEY